MADDQLVLFKQEGQHIYDYTNVYDPDVHPSSSGKIIPAVRSLVVDNRTSEWRVLMVESVDPVTFKCTYRDFPYKVIDRRSMIYNYGNDVFMLYYDDRSTPTRLVVDAKMILFGSSIAKYRLLKPNSDGVMESISSATRQGTSGTSVVVDLINVVEVTDKYVDGVRRCSECYTSATLVDGDIVTLELIDAAGTVVAEVELVAKRSTILNNLGSAVNSITAFTATANQMLSVGNTNRWYLYKGQSIDELSIFPEITFSDGTSVITPVDNSSCYIYGLENIDSNQVGTVHQIVIKYFINNRYNISNDVENVSVIGGNRRVLYTIHTLEIVDRPVSDISKLSVIPVWNNGKYSLRFYGYSKKRNNVENYTDWIMTTSGGVQTIKSNVLVSGSFNGSLFNVEQNFTISFNIPVANRQTTTYTQSFSIVLKDPASAPTTGAGREYWYIVEPESDPEIVYGIDGADLCRPVIYYDSVAGKHYISSTEFESVSEFLSAFYYNAVPPKLETAAYATVPTHFRIKTCEGVLFSGMPSAGIVIGNYGVSDGFVLSDSGAIVTSGTVIVEFMYDYSIIFGVPVSVVPNPR